MNVGTSKRELPDEPSGLRFWRGYGPPEFFKYVNDLRAHADALKVRADENERRLQHIYEHRSATGMTLVAPLLYPSFAQWIAAIDAAMSAAAGGKEKG